MGTLGFLYMPSNIKHLWGCFFKQELGYMAGRGERVGGIFTYHHLWLVKSDCQGRVEVSEPIAHSQQGTESVASVAEVSAGASRQQCANLILTAFLACHHDTSQVALAAAGRPLSHIQLLCNPTVRTFNNHS